MNRVEHLIISAVAEGRVNRNTALLAKRLLAQQEAREALAAGRACTTGPVAKKAIASLEHARKRRAAAGNAEAKAIRAMHDAVWGWNREHGGGRCDCGCGYVFRHAEEGELDHWIERSQGGPDTRENGWRLRSECHQAKTANRPPPDTGLPASSPGRVLWNARHRGYAARAGLVHLDRRAR